MSKFENFYQRQIEFQTEMCKKKPYEFEVNNIPEDNVKGFSFHIQQLISEIGEVLASDKRWKNFRNAHFDFEEKKKEIADCFIVLMNIAIFSGISAEELESTIAGKIEENFIRINKQ